MINKEFSHVNGPKDQAGGCLADLLFLCHKCTYLIEFKNDKAVFFWE